MIQTASGWQLDVVDRGPDWLFVRVRPNGGSYHDAPDVADRVWSILNRHFIYRLVLEMDEVDMLPSHLIGQLVMLQKRVMQHEGTLRLCGLKADCAQALRSCRLAMVLPNHVSRADAVLGRVTANLPR